MLGDRAVNRSIRRIDRMCHEFVVRHLPAARHLRWVSSVLRANVALERVGDYAVTSCREAIRMSGPPPERIGRDVALLASQAERILAESIEAFAHSNADQARSTLDLADGAEEAYQNAYRDLVAAAEAGEQAVDELFGALIVIRSLKRVADQAENICHHTLFTVAGEIRERKHFRILFVDERSDGLGQLAAAYARKAYPESGEFFSAGWRPADVVAPAVLEYLDRQGYEVEGLAPAKLAPHDEANRHYHVIVGLQGDPRPHLAEVPTRTALLEWDAGPPLDSLPAADLPAALAQANKAIAQHLHELMDLLEGENGD